MYHVSGDAPLRQLREKQQLEQVPLASVKHELYRSMHVCSGTQPYRAVEPSGWVTLGQRGLPAQVSHTWLLVQEGPVGASPALPTVHKQWCALKAFALCMRAHVLCSRCRPNKRQRLYVHAAGGSLSLLTPLREVSGARLLSVSASSGLVALMASGVVLQRKEREARVWAAVGRNTRPHGQHSPFVPHAWQPAGHVTPVYMCTLTATVALCHTCTGVVGSELSVGDAGLADIVVGA